MGLLDFFRAKPETRSASMSGYTAQLIGARETYISGVSGTAELTSTVQSCITLWEGAFSLAEVTGTDLLTRRDLAMVARSLALRGEAVFFIGDMGLVACSDWDLTTRDGQPRAYRLSISEAGGNRTVTALAAEVLHFRIGVDPTAPWSGSAPLRRARLTAGLLQTVESALAEVYENAPLGSSIIPFPESPDMDMDALGRGFRGKRGRVLLRESVTVTAAGGPAPVADWRPADTTPNLQQALPMEALEAARGSVLNVYGVLPALLSGAATGPLVREAQRHLAQWVLQPIAVLIAEEASAKLASNVFIDVMRPVQAFDAGGRARAVSTMIEAFARAKEAGLPADQVQAALAVSNFADNDKEA